MNKQQNSMAIQIMAYIASLGYAFSCRGEQLILTRPADSELPEKTRNQIKQHKHEIMALLNQPAKHQPQKNRAYKFIFADNKGAGTHLTDTNEKQARQEFEKQFPHYDLASFNAVNTTAH